MVIVRDTREKAGYAFDAARYEGVTVEDGSLATGDYSVKGLETLVACERKSLADLTMCLGQERQRFVRELERARGMSFSLNWSMGGNPVGSISIFTSSDSIRLSYSTRAGEQVDELVDLDRTSCNYGGERTWFLCPRCGRRVGVLFAGRRFWCRHCHGIAYAVENEDKLSRVLRRSNKLRERVKVRAGTAYPVTFKPKYMHQRTFDRIRWQIQEIELGFWLAMGERFNLTPDF